MGCDLQRMLVLGSVFACALGPRAHAVPAHEPDPQPLPIRDLASFDTSLAVRLPKPAPLSAKAAADSDDDDAARVIEPFEPFRFELDLAPAIAEHPTLAENAPTLVGPAINFSDMGPPPEGPAGSPLLVRFGREGRLYDAGYGESPGEEGSFADTTGGGDRFNRFNLDIEWTPAGAEDQLQWLVVGGVHAIEADIGRFDSANLALTEASGTVTIPTIGTGFRWNPAGDFSISTIARTQSVDRSASMVDLIISADLQLSRGVGLSAGYEFYESDLKVQNVRTEIDREGYFAKITIRF